MGIRISQVDSFTQQRYTGNPAAVCVLSEPADEKWMQNVAAEMNLSETAFALRLADDSKLNLRWFTPLSEVDLCGHATLATAHILWEEEHVRRGEPALFETRSGLLTARQGPDGIELDFPTEPVSEAVSDPGQLAELQSALGAPFKFVGKNRFDLLVEFESEEIVRALRPDFQRLEQFPARGDRDQSVQFGRIRPGLAILRAPRRHQRRPGLWLGALLSRSVLGRRSWAARSCLPTRCRAAGEW